MIERNGSGWPVRIALVLFGGMLALQSSPTFDLTKIAYLALAAACLAAALLAVWMRRNSGFLRLGAPWLMASAALTLLLGISLLVALSRGTPLLDSVRDLAPYALFAAVPIFALDPQAGRSRRALVGMLVVAGVLGGLSWAVEWLGRREILELPLDRLGFPSPQLPGLLYLFALATALTTGRSRVMWIALSGVTLALFLVTGTRSSLLLPLSALAMVATAGSQSLPASVKAYASHILVAAVLLFAFQFGPLLAAGLDVGRPVPGPGDPSAPTRSAPDVIGDRYGTLPETIGDPGSDASLRERVAQYEAAWTLFLSSPIVGVGPGHPIEWVDVSGFARAGFTADTPIVLPAKFGLLGVAVFLGFAAAYAVTTRRALQRERSTPVALTLVGYGVWAIASVPLGFLVEDKGASLALMLLLALTFSSRPWQSP